MLYYIFPLKGLFFRFGELSEEAFSFSLPNCAPQFSYEKII